jgi:hypothetical protein
MTRKTLAIPLGLTALTALLVTAPFAWNGSLEPSSVLAATSPASAKAAAVLGALAPARAAAQQNIPPNTLIGYLDTYEAEMKAAFALKDPSKRASAIAVARSNLALSANKRLTPGAVTRIDNLLGLPVSPATLGTGD